MDRGLAGYSPWGLKEPDTAERLTWLQQPKRMSDPIQKHMHAPDKSGEERRGEKGFIWDSLIASQSMWIRSWLSLGVA